MNNRSLHSRHSPLKSRSISPSKTRPGHSSNFVSQFSRPSVSVLMESVGPYEITEQLSSVYGNLRNSIPAMRSRGLSVDESSLFSYESYQYLRDKQRKYFRENSEMFKSKEPFDYNFSLSRESPIPETQSPKQHRECLFRRSKTMKNECSSPGRDKAFYNKLNSFYRTHFQDRIVPVKVPQIVTRQDYLEQRSQLKISHSVSPIKKAN